MTVRWFGSREQSFAEKLSRRWQRRGARVQSWLLMPFYSPFSPQEAAQLKFHFCCGPRKGNICLLLLYFTRKIRLNSVVTASQLFSMLTLIHITLLRPFLLLKRGLNGPPSLNLCCKQDFLFYMLNTILHCCSGSPMYQHLSCSHSYDQVNHGTSTLTGPSGCVKKRNFGGTLRL